MAEAALVALLVVLYADHRRDELLSDLLQGQLAAGVGHALRTGRTAGGTAVEQAGILLRLPQRNGAVIDKRVNTPMEPAEITIQAMTAATTFSAVLPPRFFFGVGGVKAAGGTEW